jgi:multidrug resistance efflux pump
MRATDLLAAALALGVAQSTSAATITGEVRVLESQPLYTPPSNTSPVVVRYYVPDGTEVKKGDPVLRIDPGQAAARLRTLHADIERADARAKKEVAELEVKALDAQIAWFDAEAALATARIDAALPRALLSGLDFDRYQGELQRTERELSLKTTDLKEAKDAVARRRKDGALEVERMQLEQTFQKAQVESAEVRAERDGVVLHAFDPWNGQRIDEGSSAQAGQLIGEVAGVGGAGVRAYALESERHLFARDASIDLRFDALPDIRARGHIVAISGAPEPRLAWGSGRYFVIDILIDDKIDATLLPGMSVRVRPQSERAAAATVRPIAAATMTIEGEVIARRSATLVAPPIFDVWQLNIAELVPEGNMVKKGDVVLRLEVSELDKQLNDRRNTLNEKQRERDKLHLALAERERSEALKTAEAQSELEKATRKAQQPPEVIRSIDYNKLVIDRKRRERTTVLYKERERAAARQRDAELRLVEVEIGRQNVEIARLTASIAALAIKSPIDGMMLHRADFRGEKFAVGSMAFMGLPLAEVPDMESLAVRALLPEPELTRVAVGQSVLVHIEGGAGATLPARIVTIGRVVRSKSRIQPIPIVELMLALDRKVRGMRPGQPVRVELTTAGGAE